MRYIDKLMCKGFSPPPLKEKIKIHNDIDSICAITGRHIIQGVYKHDIVTGATNQPHESFRHCSDFVSVEAARVFKWVIGGAVGNLFATDDYAAKPMVSRASAEKQNRPCWMDLVRTLQIGQKTICDCTGVDHIANR